MSAQPSKLQKLIAEAAADVRALHDKLSKAEASNLTEAVRPIRNKFNAASKKRNSLESLLTSDEGRLKQLLEHAADKRKMADNMEGRNPAKAKLMRQDAAAIEKRYLLWCDHHGKPTTLLQAPKPKASAADVQPASDGNASTLLKYIAKAKADLEKALEHYTRVKASGRKKAIQKAETEYSIASSTLKFYEGLTTTSEAKITARLDEVAQNRKQASKCEHSNPSLAQSLLEAANSVEQSYLMWCEYHGRTPMKEFQGIALLPPAETTEERKGRGGSRLGAGRPALGNVQLLFKCSPSTADKARKLAKAKGVTLGGWLDSVIDSLSS